MSNARTMRIRSGLAVDAHDNLYVTDVNGWVYELAEGATSPTVMPFNNISHPSGSATDAAGNLYVADGTKLLKLFPDASSPIALPFPGLADANAVGVDNAGNVYATDQDNHKFADDNHPASVEVGGRCERPPPSSRSET